MENDPLQGLARLISSQEEVLEQRHVVVLQLRKICIVNVGSKEGMCHVVTQGLHQLDKLIGRFQKVQRDEPDTRILPQRPFWDTPRCDHDLGPVIVQRIRGPSEFQQLREDIGLPLGRRLTDEVLNESISGDPVGTSDESDFAIIGMMNRGHCDFVVLLGCTCLVCDLLELCRRGLLKESFQ